MDKKISFLKNCNFQHFHQNNFGNQIVCNCSGNWKGARTSQTRTVSDSLLMFSHTVITDNTCVKFARKCPYFSRRATASLTKKALLANVFRANFC